MELVLTQKLRRIFYILAITLCGSTHSFATWQGPIDVVSLKWGDQVGEVAIKYGDTEDTFPTNIEVGQNRIVVPDKGNGRVYMFSLNGKLLQTFEPVKYRYAMVYDPRFIADYILLKGKDDYMLYDYRGKLEHSFKGVIYIKELAIIGGSIFVYDYKGKQYYQYSPSGELLKTYTERPPELGIVESKSLGNKHYRTKIKYPDLTYTISRHDHDSYVRGCGNILYGMSNRRIQMYNVNGELIAEFIKPENKKKILRPAGGGFEERSEVVEQFGAPVISPSGDIYCWKRTPDTYSIIKWVWTDGPDAPVVTAVSASKDGLNVSWQPPEQNAEEVEGYEIVRSTDVCGPFKPIESVSQNVLQYKDKAVEEDTTYYYQIQAIKKGGYSGYSNKAVGLKK